jgi:hypothetical protein
MQQEQLPPPPAKRPRTEHYVCKLCKQPFVLPATLPCGCTFCTDCLKSLAEAAAVAQIDTMTCPTCGAKHARALFANVRHSSALVDAMRRELGDAEIARIATLREQEKLAAERAALERDVLAFCSAHDNGVAEFDATLHYAYVHRRRFNGDLFRCREAIAAMIADGRLGCTSQCRVRSEAAPRSTDYAFAPALMVSTLNLMLRHYAEMPRLKSVHCSVLVDMLSYVVKRLATAGTAADVEAYAELQSSIIAQLQKKAFKNGVPARQHYIGLSTRVRRHCVHCAGGVIECTCQQRCARNGSICIEKAAPAASSASSSANK